MRKWNGVLTKGEGGFKKTNDKTQTSASDVRKRNGVLTKGERGFKKTNERTQTIARE